MSEALRVAVVGADTLVGEALIALLEERQFAVAELHPLASSRSLGRSVEFRGRHLPSSDLAGFDFGRVQLAFLAAGEQTSRELAPRAAECGCVVIDGTGAFADETDVPLVVPEVNAHAIAEYTAHNLVASPDALTIQLAVALKPLHDAVGIEQLHVATYEAVSGVEAGRQALDELAAQSAALLSGRGPVCPHVIEKQIAFNCVPQVDQFLDGGRTRAELALHARLRRVLEDEGLTADVTAVRVPVFYGHSAAVHLRTRAPIDEARARALLQNARGVTVLDERRPGGYPTAATEAANRDTVYVGRIREDMSYGRGLNLWIVADNVRKGAATNAIQIAEVLVREYL
ncbi:MAG TPA: aspartate-semialdehyde dehydrogenase [Steroidobacteraceae bacterium]|nr:aspartate-semialdehyde dehydrogenase [Steroidobacteraceae bacterium]